MLIENTEIRDVKVINPLVHNDDRGYFFESYSLKNFNYSSGKITIGNVEIFNLLISKLDIPKRWKLRLSRHFWREDYFNDLLKRLESLIF